MAFDMRRILFTILALAFVVGGVSAAEPWEEDAVRGKHYYDRDEFDAAWLFYSQSLAAGNTDGIDWYRAARSFKYQEVVEDDDLMTSLYTVARYYLLEQYPDHRYVGYTEGAADLEAEVDRPYLKNTYRALGSKPPRRSLRMPNLLDAIPVFMAKRLSVLREWRQVVRESGIAEGVRWGREHLGELLLAWLMVSLVSGILLPIVMGVVAARVGRKSYVAAYALWFHWGFLGIHRFYLRRYVSGIIWLLTGGLLGIGIFLDLFLTGTHVRFWNEGRRPAKMDNKIIGGLLKKRPPKKTKAAPTATASQSVADDDFDLGSLSEA